MDDIDRARVAELLASVRDADDAAALAAVREADGLLRDAGVTWEALLEPAPAPVPEPDEDDEPSRHDDDVDDETELETDGAEPPPPPLPPGDEAALIERLLKRSDLSADARVDIQGFRDDLARGELDPMDVAYMRALAQRLGR